MFVLWFNILCLELWWFIDVERGGGGRWSLFWYFGFCAMKSCCSCDGLLYAHLQLVHLFWIVQFMQFIDGLLSIWRCSKFLIVVPAQYIRFIWYKIPFYSCFLSQELGRCVWRRKERFLEFMGRLLIVCNWGGYSWSNQYSLF